MEFNNINVLVAEDQFINYKLIETILTKEGINVIIAKNGEEAFEKFQNEKVDLILMDLQMPIMDGVETTKKIREIDKNIPILALSAYSENEIEKFIKDVNMDGYLIKPLRRDLLLEKIKENLTKK